MLSCSRGVMLASCTLCFWENSWCIRLQLAMSQAHWLPLARPPPAHPVAFARASGHMPSVCFPCPACLAVVASGASQAACSCTRPPAQHPSSLCKLPANVVPMPAPAAAASDALEAAFEQLRQREAQATALAAQQEDALRRLAQWQAEVGAACLKLQAWCPFASFVPICAGPGGGSD